MTPTAEDLLREMIEAIEATRKDGKFYPELVFEQLRGNWLKWAKIAVDWQATPSPDKPAGDPQ